MCCHRARFRCWVAWHLTPCRCVAKQYGIQPNARDSEGRTALHLAVGLLVGAATSSPQAVGEIVHALLQAGARPNICATASPDSTVEKMVRKAGMSSLWSSMQASAAKFARKQAPPAASSECGFGCAWLAAALVRKPSRRLSFMPSGCC